MQLNKGFGPDLGDLGAENALILLYDLFFGRYTLAIVSTTKTVGT